MALVPTESMAGQTVPVIPITLVAADPLLQNDTIYAPYRERRPTLLWADSLIGEALTGRAPEANWVLPPKLRKMARRAPGLVGDPDQMGQAVMRAPKLKIIPDPLRSSLRSLVAISGGRIVMIPASLGFSRDSLGAVRADLSLVLADARSGKVVWRSLATGSGATPPLRARRGPRRRPATRFGTTMTYDVTLIAGDGIGPEITAQTVKVLEATGLRFNWDDELAGMAAVEATGTPLPDATVESIRKNGLALKGPLTTPVGTGFRSVNVGLRKEFELFANIRPAKTHHPRRPVRERGHRARPREPRGPLHRGRALRADRRRPPRRRRVDGDRHPHGVRADHPLRVRVRPQARPPEGHHRAQGEHPQDGERALPGGGAQRSRRSTRAGSSPTT